MRYYTILFRFMFILLSGILLYSNILHCSQDQKPNAEEKVSQIKASIQQSHAALDALRKEFLDGKKSLFLTMQEIRNRVMNIAQLQQEMEDITHVKSFPYKSQEGLFAQVQSKAKTFAENVLHSMGAEYKYSDQQKQDALKILDELIKQKNQMKDDFELKNKNISDPDQKQQLNKRYKDFITALNNDIRQQLRITGKEWTTAQKITVGIGALAAGMALAAGRNYLNYVYLSHKEPVTGMSEGQKVPGENFDSENQASKSQIDPLSSSIADQKTKGTQQITDHQISADYYKDTQEVWQEHQKMLIELISRAYKEGKQEGRKEIEREQLSTFWQW